MDIIQLAQFDFDNGRLEKGIEDLQKQLFQLTKRQQELNEQTKETKKALDAQTKESLRLVQNFKNGSQEYQKVIQDMAKLKRAGEENSQAYKDLNTQKQNLISSFKSENKEYQQASNNVTLLTKKQEGLFLSTKDLQIERELVNKEYKTATTLYKQFIGVNGEILSLQDVINNSINKEVKSREEAKRVNIQLNKIKDQLNLTNENEVKLLDEINKRIDANNDLLKESGSLNEKRIANIGQYSQGIQEAAGNLDIFNGGLLGFIERAQEAGGAGNLITNSFNQAKTSIIGMTKAMIAFILTPAGALITLLGTAVLIAKELIKYNNEVAKTDKLIRGITKTTADTTTQIRLMGTALQETFGTDLEETVQTAKVLVNEFGITYEEALNQIQQGLVRGQEGNKEYLDSLREYSTFFSRAGYSVEEFRNIVAAGYDLGIYTDKLPDAIKEFTLSITEQTKATKDALIASFGEDFTNTILKGVQKGSIDIKDALKQIAEQAQKSNLNLQQQAQLTADVFKGAGEDAGGALKIFQAINKSYADQSRALTNIEQKTQDLYEANLELAKAKDEALNSDELKSFTKTFELLWIRVKTAFYDFFDRWVKDIRFMITSFWELGRTINDVINQISTTLRNFDLTNPLKTLKELANISFKETWKENIKATIQQQAETKRLAELEKSRAELNRIASGVASDAQKRLMKETVEKGKIDRAAEKAAEKAIDLQIAKQREQLELWIAQQGDKARTLQEQLDLEKQISDRSIQILNTELQNKRISQEKYDTEILKLKQDTARIQAQIAVEAAERELKSYEYENQTKLKDGQLLTAELLKQEIDRNKALQAERDAFAKTQLDNGQINKDEYNAMLLANEREYLEQEKSLRSKYSEDQIREEAAIRQAKVDQEVLTLQSAGDNEYNRIQQRLKLLDFEANEEKIRLDQQKIDGEISEENHQLQLANIDKNYANQRKEIEKAVFDNKLQLASSTFGNLAAIFGEESAAGKAMAVAQATIDTYKAATSAYSAMSGIPIVGPALGAIAAAAAVASGIANVKKITQTKMPTISAGSKSPKGYATGGKIIGGLGINRSNGDNVLITARTGEAILNERQQAFIGKDILSLAGVPGFATGGRIGVNSSSLAAVQNGIINKQPLFDVDSFVAKMENAVQTGSQTGSLQGTSTGSQQGISQYSHNRLMQTDSIL